MKVTPFRAGFALLLASFPLVFTAAAADKHVPTHEDIWLMKRVGAPQGSPNGRWIVVAVIEPSYDENATLSDLWLVDAPARHPSPRPPATPLPASGAGCGPGTPPIGSRAH